VNALLIEPDVAVAAALVVPAQDPQPPPGRGPEFGKASPVGLVVIIMLGLATVLLIRNMSQRIKRLPRSFDDPNPNPNPDPDPGTARRQEPTSDEPGSARPDGEADDRRG